MKIENQKLNVGEAFTQYIYTIPDYQREYVWKEKEVTKLIEDVTEEYSKDNNKSPEYFIGSMVVNRQGNDVEVIDGQQRLTTLFLYLCAFRKMLHKENEDTQDIDTMLFSKRRDEKGKLIPSYNLKLTYENTSQLLEDIVQDRELRDDLTGSAKNITDAYNTILRDIPNNLKTKAELLEFLAYFTQKVNFIQIETPSISDALKIFETINERGVGLNPMDLLKNLIFRTVDREEFAKLKVEWKKITDLLEKNEQKPLRFLRYYIMANYQVKNAKGEEIVREDEIYDWITQKENAIQCNYEAEPFKFVRFIQDNAEAYVMFSKGLNKNNQKNVYLDNIKNLSGSFSQHLILLLAAKGLQKELFDYLAKQVEVLIFYYILTKAQTKELERKFSKWAKDVKKLEDLNGKEQKEGLNKFVSEKLEPEIKSREVEFKDDFLKFNFESLQQYRLKYILAKIEQYVELQALDQKEPELLDSYLKTKIEIEHILPNKPSKELRESFERETGEDTYEEYKIKLGNLTLLEKPINGSIGNDFFDEKKKEYKKSKFRLAKSIAIIENVGNTSITRINRQLLSFEEWDANSINKRQEMLYNLAKKIWIVEALG